MKTSEKKDTSSNLSANDLKEQGNKLFSHRKYNDAVASYSKAVTKNPNVATYFTNRALCYLKLKQWQLAVQDCKRSLEIENSLVKGHFFQGQAMLEMYMYDEAITCLTRAQDLAREQRLNYGDEITGTLRIAKKRRWNIIEEKRIQEEIELQTYLNKLILEDKERRLKATETREEKDKSKEEREDIDKDCSKRLEEVQGIFEEIDERRKKREVPDHLCGKISFELMKDPVITPSGITYDRKDIEEHLQRVGHFDPVTRQELTQDKLIPNLAMKEVVDHFNEQSPWAEYY